jgi:hypothetical protein
MSVRTKHLKLVGVGSAVALAVGAVAAPALAAGTASVNYTCTTPLTPATPTADYTVDTAPATMVVGQPLSTTAAFTLDPGTTALAQGLGWVTFKGTITTKPSGSQAGLALKFPKTTLGTGAGGSTDAAAKGATLAGTKVGAFTFVLGDLGDVKLTGFDSGGKKVGTVEFPTTGSFGPCINDAGTTTLMDGGNPVTTTLVKDASKTAVAAKYVAKKKTTVAVAKVSGKVGHLPGTGKGPSTRRASRRSPSRSPSSRASTSSRPSSAATPGSRPPRARTGSRSGDPRLTRLICGPGDSFAGAAAVSGRGVLTSHDPPVRQGPTVTASL